jgi:hypothetical protein
MLHFHEASNTNHEERWLRQRRSKKARSKRSIIAPAQIYPCWVNKINEIFPTTMRKI